jgi:hypothetical protein
MNNEDKKLIADYMCNVCKKIKPQNEFYSNKSLVRGFAYLCAECSKKKTHKYYRNNREQVKNRIREWNKLNPEKIKIYNKRAYKKEASNITLVLSDRIRNRINETLHSGTKSKRRWESLVGYTVEQLKAHLEKNFKEGMNWDNYGTWHIDHKIPITAFNFEKPEDIDFKKCWSLKNIQPLWAGENIRKRNKLHKPFQPSLCIGC